MVYIYTSLIARLLSVRRGFFFFFFGHVINVRGKGVKVRGGFVCFFYRNEGVLLG